MMPKLENPNDLKLSAEVQQVILQLFNEYKRIIIRKIYEEGLSGGKVIEVQAIKADGTPELPAVVKVAAISLIQKEWQAYGQHIRYRLHNAANIMAEPMLLPEVGWGGLRYTLMGGGAFEVATLRDYLFRDEVTARDASYVLERLLRFMHNLWGHHALSTNFHLAQGYSHLLPVDLLFQTMPTNGVVKVHDLTPASLATLSLEPGDWVRVSGFVINKVNPDTQTATLEQRGDAGQNRHHLVRWKALSGSDLNQFYLHQPAEGLTGQVVETRLSRLQAEVQLLLGDEFELTAASLSLPGLNDISVANPLCHFEAVLKQITSANVASIHGDLNLANTLVEPETGILSLIDFAEARTDHVLHDLLRLETEITTYLLAEIACRHEWPPAVILGYLYWHLHGLARQSAVAPPQQLPRALEKAWALLMTIRQTARRYFCQANVPTEYYRGLYLYLLGALKFKNLNRLATAPWPKQMAFWGAALTYHFLTASEAELARLADALRPLPDPEPARNQKYQQTTDNGTAASKPMAPQSLSLPLDLLPALSYLPADSRMPLSRNLLFVGRQHDLQFLAHSFTQNPMKPVAITGLGGLGKTQLACEFVHRYGCFFTGGVFWLSFAEPKSVAAEIAACGGSGFMDLRPDFAELPLQEQVDLVLAEWRRPLPRLLIFDNCEDPELLQQWRPTTGGCHILLTSRRADWKTVLGVQMLRLEVLSRPESLALLRNYYPDAEDDALAAIAQEVGDLPLALHLAGSFLAHYRYSIGPEEYLERLRDPSLHPKLLASDWGASPTEHMQNVSRTITLSYDQLNPEKSIDM